eukprot:TRINITY_DN18264_c0_g2_i1.p1 TRINITY_DN18264_c0_g2~~TRINITY_DN18264_c0_g2_i1.p1  ORF type:complete len:114 (-),score=16.66 TRINITY_DN18264_c0_g2_i1:365-706(-)
MSRSISSSGFAPVTRVAARSLSSLWLVAKSVLVRFLGFEQLHGMAGHDGRDRVLVDQLRVTVTAQQHAEIVEPGDDALQLHAVDEEDRQRNLLLPHMVEESVLEILSPLGGHG